MKRQCLTCNKELIRRPTETKSNFNNRKRCNYTCANLSLTTRKFISCEYCEKMTTFNLYKIKQNKHHFCSLGCRYAWRRNGVKGSNNPNWRGGVAKLSDCIRALVEYKDWRVSVFKRDRFTCVECKDSSGGNLNADHIVPLSVLIVQNNIKTQDDAKNTSQIWDLTNGRTLCYSCHRKTNTWGNPNVVKEYLYAQ